MIRILFMMSLTFFLLFIGLRKGYAQEYTKEQIASFQQKSEQGNADAQTKLGLIYFTGNGVSSDKPTGIKLFLQAAEKGDAQAQHYLGWIYARGDGVETDKKKAFYWYHKSAEQGHRDSQENLANIYMKGDGVEKDYAAAKMWYTKASEQGSTSAQYELAVMYRNGEGGEQNTQKAKEWFQKSADGGYEEAKEALSILNIEVKADQYAAQRMSDVYSIASLIEEYKTKMGHYPFYNPQPAKTGYVKTGTLAVLAAPVAEEKLIQKPNPFSLSSSRALLSHLKAELEKGLGRQVTLPVDPQEVALYAPNAYYAYFSVDDEYVAIAFLYSPNEYTSQLFGPHANMYAIASSDKAAIFWKNSGLKPRIFSDIAKTKNK